MKNKKLLIIVIASLFSLNLNAQALNIDSLKNIINTQVEDTFKINVYNHLSEYYMFYNPDSGLFYANEGLELASKISDKKGVGIAYRLIALNYHFLSQNDTAIFLMDKAIKIFKDIDFRDGLTTCMMNKGILQTRIDLFDEAIENYNNAFNLFETDSNSLGMANCKVNIATIYDNQSDYTNAISLYIDAEQFYKEINSEEGIGSCKLNIGNIYIHLKEYEKAIEYFKEGLILSKKINNKIKEAMLLNSIGSSYKKLGRLDSALTVFNTALEIGLETKSKDIISDGYNNIGSVYNDMGDYEKAMDFYNKSIEIKEELNSKKELVSLYYNFGFTLYKIKQYNAAQKNTEISIKYAKFVNNLRQEMDAQQLLYLIFKETNQNQKALAAHEKYSSIKDSIFNTNKYEIINELETKYQTAEKEKENQKLQFDNQLQKEENAKVKTQDLYIISLSGLIILLLLITFLMFRNKQRNKFNKLMLNEIDEQNDIISKNLHDGMSGYLHAIKNSLAHRNETSKDLDNEINIIDRSQKELRFLLRQLSSPYYKNKNFDLSQELNELNSFYENTSNFKIDSYFDKNIVWDNISYENKLQIYRLAQELLANVKKHSGATDLSLQIIKDKNDLIMSLEDNGEGYDTNETSQGYGLKNINKRIKELRGELNIDSNIGKGTFITLKLPVLS